MSTTERRKWLTLHALRLDRAALQLINTLTVHGVPALLLKGASFRQWLYRNEGRFSIDVDLLIPQTAWNQGVQAIESLGFVLDRLGPTGGNWYRDSDHLWLDLHYTLWGVSVSPPELWTQLWGEREMMQLHGVAVPILNEPARLFHAVMHAAQTGNAKSKAAEDLARAVLAMTDARWREAWAIASTLRAKAHFADSLRLYAPDGSALADRLGAPTRMSFLACVHALEEAPAAGMMDELFHASWRYRLTILKRWIWPEHGFNTDLERGKIPAVPPWVQHRKSRVLRFYLWRGHQTLSFLRACRKALRLRQAPHGAHYHYRREMSRPWRDDR